LLPPGILEDTQSKLLVTMNFSPPQTIMKNESRMKNVFAVRTFAVRLLLHPLFTLFFPFLLFQLN